jgi:signal transduction histidine kinase
MSETLPLPMTSTPVPEAARPVEPPRLMRRLALDTAYSLSALPLAVVGFVVVVTGVASGVGLLVIWVGLAVLAATMYAARALAHLERIRLRNLQGRSAPSPVYRTTPPDAGPVRRLLTSLRDPQSWLDALWGVAGFVTGIVAFVVTVAWWAGALGGLTYWFWQQWLPEDDVTLVELMGLGEGQRAESLLYLAFGVVLALTLPAAVRAVSITHAGLASALLCSRAELQAEVRRVAGSREAAHRAEADSLRRLERDIHDGPQQRLVRLTMDLGRARKQLADDPERASTTIESALNQARETVDELRSLSRGIAPPLLVDRGLRVALEEMLRGSVVPVQSTIDVPAHLPPQVETAIYFVVAEALTNVAKHSGAQQARVSVTAAADAVTVVVEDDGIGGAHESKGLGLAGLRQRLAGVDGVLGVTSPAGGPTVLEARIPTTSTPGGD